MKYQKARNTVLNAVIGKMVMMSIFDKIRKAVKHAAAICRSHVIIVCLCICLCAALFVAAATVHVPPDAPSESEGDLLMQASVGESSFKEESSSAVDENSDAEPSSKPQDESKGESSSGLQDEPSSDPNAGSSSGPQDEPSSAPTEEPPRGGTADENPSAPANGEGFWISDVPFISQVGKYPTGCESVSAVMACQYAGISIDVETFIDEYLPKAPFTRNGEKLIGYHPDHCFMGDPYTTGGFGCWAPCIETAIRAFLPEGYVLENYTGTDLPSLCSRLIDRGIPVIIWATMNMSTPTDGMTWTLLETGEPFQWISGEHCLVLTGYDQKYYYFNDPLKGKVKYKKDLAEKRFSQMGLQALAVYQFSIKDDLPEDSSSIEENESFDWSDEIDPEQPGMESEIN